MKLIDAHEAGINWEELFPLGTRSGSTVDGDNLLTLWTI